MTEQVSMYHSLFIIFLAASFILFIISIVLFVLLRVPQIIGELTGSAARKEIRAIQAANAERTAADVEGVPSMKRRRDTSEDETEMLTGARPNPVLADGVYGDGETVVLEPQEEAVSAQGNEGTAKFVIIREVMLVHTDEVL